MSCATSNLSRSSHGLIAWFLYRDKSTRALLSNHSEHLTAITHGFTAVPSKAVTLKTITRLAIGRDFHPSRDLPCQVTA